MKIPRLKALASNGVAKVGIDLAAFWRPVPHKTHVGCWVSKIFRPLNINPFNLKRLLAPRVVRGQTGSRPASSSSYWRDGLRPRES